VKYTICIDRQAAKTLTALPPNIQRQIARKIDSLANDPFPSGFVPIQGMAGLYRIKSGEYRIAYKVEGKKLIVLVIRVGHRKDFY